jgi:Kef-type K+ transport system membrane component KefB
MTRSPSQKLSLLVAVLLFAAPLCFGLFRWWQTGSDSRMLWMAALATIFTAGLLATTIGRRRSRKAAYTQSIVILVVSTIIAGVTGFILGAISGPGVWAVAFVLSALLALSSFFVWLSRSATSGSTP